MTEPNIEVDVIDLTTDVDPVEVEESDDDQADAYTGPPGDCAAELQDGDNDAEVGDE